MNIKLQEKVEKIRAMSIEELCEKFKCLPEQICLGDYIARNTNDTVCPYKVIMGFANFEGSNVTSLGPLEVVVGKQLKEHGLVVTNLEGINMYHGLNLRNSEVKNLGNLKIVYGSCSLNENICSLENFKFAGSGLFLYRTGITVIDSEIIVDGMLSVDNSKVQSLGLLKKATIINADSKYLTDLGEVEEFTKILFSKQTNKKLIDKIIKDYTRTNGKFIKNSLVNSVY